jgi:hypothetical protein
MIGAIKKTASVIMEESTQEAGTAKRRQGRWSNSNAKLRQAMYDKARVLV